MPKIDVYTAPTTPVVPNQPLHFAETGVNPAAGVEQQSKLIGHQLSTIAGNIVAQQDTVDFGLARTNYEAAPKQIGMDTALDPEVIQNPLLYQQKFNERLQAYQKQLIDNTPNDRIHGAIQNMYAERDPEIQYHARVQGLKLAADDNMAKLNANAEAKAKLGAEAITTGNPRMATRLVNDYTKEVMDAVLNRHMTKEEAQKNISHMENLMKEKEMFIYATGGPASRNLLYEKSKNGDFDGVDPVKHSAIMNRAFAADEADERHVVQQAHKRRNDDTENYFSLALTDQLSVDVIDAIEAGKTNADPRIGPHLRKILDDRSKPLAEKSVKEHDPVVRDIAIQYSAGRRTLDVIEAERNALIKHVTENGNSDDALKRLDHLAGEGRSERNALLADQTRGTSQALRYTDDAVGATRPTPSTRPRTAARQRYVEQLIDHDMRLLVQDPSFDKSQRNIRETVENLRKKYDPTGATGKDTRTPEQKASDDFGAGGR